MSWIRTHRWPRIEDNSVVLCDSKISRTLLPRIGRGSKLIRLHGGESLKTLKNLDRVLNLTLKLPFDVQRFVAVGGGSMTDFGAFLASVYKRGRPVIHVPSTPLAALDAAHGGKTALNVGPVKNYIGSFWEPEQVWWVEPLLGSAPGALFKEAFSELLKMALLTSEDSVVELAQSTSSTRELFLEHLEPMVQGKRAIVALDPREKRGLRRILNLGHTVAHALELHRQLSHGSAVAQGLRWALRWSELLTDLRGDWIEVCESILDRHGLMDEFEPLGSAVFEQALSADKKRTGSKIQEVFLSAPGEPVLLDLPLSKFVEMGQKVGWVRGA